MAKKTAKKTTAKKKSTRKEPAMQTLPSVTVHMANEYLKIRKKQMAETGDEIDWDGGLEDLWRALICTYWGYGEQDIKDFLKQEIAAIKKIKDNRTTSEQTAFRLVR